MVVVVAVLAVVVECGWLQLLLVSRGCDYGRTSTFLSMLALLCLELLFCDGLFPTELRSCLLSSFLC